jgi:deoxyadenosine/deoxycytidine kinase
MFVNKIYENVKNMDNYFDLKFDRLFRKMNNNRFIISVEGNIGSGKSTLVEYLKNNLKKIGKYDVIYLQEPVNIWNGIVDKMGKSILEKYYTDPQKYSFSFQMMAYITRLDEIKSALKNSLPNTIIITERCLFTDREVFAKMLYDSGNIEEIEYIIYNKWFDSFLEYSLVSGYIYLKTCPDICLQRINSRSRNGENSIQLDYLQKCEEYHENWLNKTEQVIEIN